MTPLAAVGFAFFGSIIGFLAGIFFTLGTPAYLKIWHQKQEAKEARRATNEMLKKITDMVGDKAEAAHMAAVKSRLDKA